MKFEQQLYKLYSNSTFGFKELEKKVKSIMSYDVKIGPFETNHTYNGATEIKELIGFTISSIDGLPACVAYKLVDDMLKVVVKNKSKLKPILLSKYYGWGTYESWIIFLTEIKNACKMHQFETVIIN